MVRPCGGETGELQQGIEAVGRQPEARAQRVRRVGGGEILCRVEHVPEARGQRVVLKVCENAQQLARVAPACVCI